MAPDPLVTSLPGDGLIVLVGPSGSGKSTWAAARFAPTEVLSSDAFRELVAGDAADQSATADAFKLLHLVVRARLRRGLRAVVDATNLTESARRSLLRMARQAERPAVAIVFDISLERCLQHNAARPGRSVPEAVVRRHERELRHAMARLPAEGYTRIVRLQDDDIDEPRLGMV